MLLGLQRSLLRPLPALRAAQWHDLAFLKLQSGSCHKWMDETSLTLPVFHPRRVTLAILGVGFPRAAVVNESQFVHHDDALFHRANLRALPAAGAELVGDVIQAIGGLI